jgi:arsenite-transporting ATPase
MRIIVMCGKGGTGKTALGAALGARAAASGKRTLVFSVDPAHSLSSILDTPLGPQPTPVADKLWAAELEAFEEIEANWTEVRDYFTTVMQSQGLENRLGGEISSLPGINEFAALVKLKQFYDSKQFDTIVIDNAPTGFALRLLSLPAIFSWYAKHAIKLYERHGAQLLLMAPMVGATFPIPNAQVIDRTFGLVELLKDLPLILADPAVTSTRLVLSADRLALDEAKTAYSYLCLYGLNADAVFVNQLLPSQVTDSFFERRREVQAGILAQAKELFAPLPVLEVPLQEDVIDGLASVQSLGASIWPSGDPSEQLSPERAITIDREGEQILVSIKLPFISSKDVDLAKFENELYITIGQHRRNLVLSPETTEMQPVKAKFAEGRLLVTLARPS